MVRLGKLTDYGLVLMSCMARSYGSSVHASSDALSLHASPASALHDSAGSSLRTARDLALESKLPVSTVSKLLKGLLQSGLLTSHRGIKGGYLLARDPHTISVLDVIAALEGPMALTECSTDVSGLCHIEPCCPIKTNQQIINQAVRGVLEKVMLSDLANPMQLTSIRDVRGRLVPAIASSIQ
ncbi:MAG: Rrf2 family transcriptional regulator [Candidatus Acidiferrales bacterium]